MTREIPDGLTIQAAIIDLAAGNIGACSVLIELGNTNRSELILYLYSEEIRGSDIWNLYKSNGQDIDQFAIELELQRMVRDG